MTTRVFDASSLVALVLERGGVGVERVFDGYLLDLTFYEVGNAFWKARTLQDRITPEDLADVMAFLESLESELTVAPVGELDLDRTMEVAVDEAVTFYDAAYVVVAEERDLALVTEDGELAEAAADYVAVESAADLD